MIRTDVINRIAAAAQVLRNLDRVLGLVVTGFARSRSRSFALASSQGDAGYHGGAPMGCPGRKPAGMERWRERGMREA
ncbi:MAG: hypothetical protein RLY93_18150 [Sumerlaeia bacterium]